MSYNVYGALSFECFLPMQDVYSSGTVPPSVMHAVNLRVSVLATYSNLGVLVLLKRSLKAIE